MQFRALVVDSLRESLDSKIFWVLVAITLAIVAALICVGFESDGISMFFGLWVFETDQFDTTQRYVVNATLFASADGTLTTQQPSANHPGVAMCTGPPTGIVETLEFLWY